MAIDLIIYMLQLVITYITVRAGGRYTCSVLGGQQQVTQQFEYCSKNI